MPASSEAPAYHGTTIILLNPTKADFTVDGNGENIYLSSDTPISSFVLGTGESCTLMYMDTEYPGWYELS